MVRRVGNSPGAQRKGLYLYAGLVVVPALVFGALLWQQLTRLHREQREEVPRVVRHAAGRLQQVIEQELDALLARESAREFYVYQQDYYEFSTIDDGAGALDLRPIPSPLAVDPPLPGIRAWFEWDLVGLADIPPEILAPLRPRPSAAEAIAHTHWRQDFERFVEEELIGRAATSHEYFLAQADARSLLDDETTRPKLMSIEQVALNCSPERDLECVEEHRISLRQKIGGLSELGVTYGPFELQAMRDSGGELHLVAQRKVVIEALPEEILVPRCYTALERNQILVQGFDLDPHWLFVDLPARQAARVLGPEIRYHPAGHGVPSSPDVALEVLDLWTAFEIEVDGREDVDPHLGQVHVSSSVAGLDQAFRTQLFWLLGVTAVMVASLVIGVRLLVGSVRTTLAQARRTENFVAAVTHELRTPIAAVKMYGEMLRDGWARDEGRRADYLARIVRESDRLDDLVDKVLTKQMLAEHAPRPAPGDLSALVSHMTADLRVVGGQEHDDLEFVLAPGLPPVLLYPEGLREVLVNLVENARKYAPVAPGGEPIRVETGLDRKGRVMLEVSDRGPGIPEQERARVFEPFYRLGDESTRRSVGTGLGLHLVELQARAMKARVQLRPREGGGCVFRVSFKTLRPGTLA